LSPTARPADFKCVFSLIAQSRAATNSGAGTAFMTALSHGFRSSKVRLIAIFRVLISALRGRSGSASHRLARICQQGQIPTLITNVVEDRLKTMLQAG
jgi:hypothetical protein